MRDTAGEVGQPILMNAHILGDLEPAGLQWTLQIPQQLTLVSWVTGPVAATKSINCNPTSGICLVFGFNQDTLPNGIVAQLGFESATAGSFPIGVVDTLATDPDGLALPATGLGAIVQVN